MFKNQLQQYLGRRIVIYNKEIVYTHYVMNRQKKFVN